MKKRTLLLVIFVLSLVIPVINHVYDDVLFRQTNMNNLYAAREKNWSGCTKWHGCWYCCLGSNYAHCNTPSCESCNLTN